ncbi:MAG: hypothetical protein NTX29_15125 [Actinobacteria bacterium]|nr:hypothetical protein [Actinomycetota bacterium]
MEESAYGSDPIWLDWVEPEVVDLSDEQLQQYVDDWSSQADGYRRRRRRVNKEHPDAFRFGYSAWWCSKNASKGRREQARRQIKSERGGAK